jgi:hypothetical protein
MVLVMVPLGPLSMVVSGGVVVPPVAQFAPV